MKKLSLIMAMVLIATIGGVYATWTYAGSSINSPHEHAVLRMEDYHFSDGLGELTLNATGAKISIDEDPDTTHKAKIVISGQFVITFKPNPIAPVELKEEGIPIAYTLATSVPTTTWTFNDTQIFKAITDKTDIALEKSRWEKQSDGSFVMSIPASEILGDGLTGAVQFASEFILDDIDKYEAFEAALGGGKFGLTIKSTYVPAQEDPSASA